jgi:hypothetical protein
MQQCLEYKAPFPCLVCAPGGGGCDPRSCRGNTTKATWIDRENNELPIGLPDILIIAPYNAQLFELQDRIPGGRIGRVDKFQGQEAPIVIYSSRPQVI